VPQPGLGGVLRGSIGPGGFGGPGSFGARSGLTSGWIVAGGWAHDR
jgi:hypothetical protein